MLSKAQQVVCLLVNVDMQESCSELSEHVLYVEISFIRGDMDISFLKKKTHRLFLLPRFSQVKNLYVFSH